MIDNYNIRFYKNNARVAPRTMGSVDARLFYRQMKMLMKVLEITYEEKLNEESILISVDGVETYRRRDRMLESGIETVGDFMEYIGVDFKPSHIFINNILGNKKASLIDAYVIRVVR